MTCSGQWETVGFVGTNGEKDSPYCLGLPREPRGITPVIGSLATSKGDLPDRDANMDPAEPEAITSGPCGHINQYIPFLFWLHHMACRISVP